MTQRDAEAVDQLEVVPELVADHFVPYSRSPASPRPGTMKPFSFKPAVDRGADDVHVGVFRVHALDPFGRRDDADEDDVARARLLHLADRRDARVAGREHRVEDDRVALLEVGRQLHEVLDRLERLLVAVEADEADARARDQRQHAVEHADAGAQHRAHGDLLAGDARHARPLERRLDLDLLARQVLRRLVGQQERDLLDELAEVDGRRRLVAQVRELVLYERVLHMCHAPLRLHGCGHAA